MPTVLMGLGVLLAGVIAGILAAWISSAWADEEARVATLASLVCGLAWGIGFTWLVMR